MTANGDYITVVNMDRDLITTVSQEFVLQFYTIMNKHPGSLHRFYKEESTLIRDEVHAQGQNEIHKYYMNLELSNCKAVVLSLDAVKSHGKSILIQVTGEIANNGCDLRRFMQSFLLVEQDLGNFYVLNDIFRYQDQTFKVEDVEEAPIVEHESKNEEIHGEINSWNEMSRNCELNNEQIPQSPQLIEHEEGKLSSEIPVEIDSQQDIGQKMEEMNIKEKSWAAIINPMSSRPSKPTAPVAPQPQTAKPIQQKQINSNGDNMEKRKPRFNNGNVKTQSTLNYPDEHQLFVGNLPQNMTEDELKDFFSEKYGPVKDVRIQKSRTSNEGKPLPNFGFLVFHNHEVVEEILKNKPIYYSAHRLNVEQKMGSSRGSHKAGRR
uniref:GTPase activating protein n=1 Tax=Dugesia japonica TaxID=6161 RepID=D5JG82_DUGJA|nr:GTPase activating protein [Dugesia japonica]